MSSPCWAATSRIRFWGPTRIGSISLSLAASTTLSSETWSHGCATATFTGRCFWAFAINLRNFSWLLRLTGASASSTDIAFLLFTGRSGLHAEQLFDFGQPPLTFVYDLALRRDDALDSPQRGGAVVRTGRQQLRDCRNGLLLVQLQQQILLAKRLLELSHRPGPSGGLRIMQRLDCSE